jgi:hypothetical protein
MSPIEDASRQSTDERGYYQLLFLVREERKKTIVIQFFFFRVFCAICGQYSSYLYVRGAV